MEKPLLTNLIHFNEQMADIKIFIEVHVDRNEIEIKELNDAIDVYVLSIYECGVKADLYCAGIERTVFLDQGCKVEASSST